MSAVTVDQVGLVAEPAGLHRLVRRSDSRRIVGVMPLKTDKIEEPNLNLTPMIDIVFLLIIFFMVGTQFTELERQYDVQLPKVAEAQPLTSRPDELIINVKGDGTIIVGGEEKTLDQLETELKEAKQNFVDQAVLIRGEGEGRYQPVVDVLSACNRAEISTVSLAYRIETGGQ